MWCWCCAIIPHSAAGSSAWILRTLFRHTSEIARHKKGNRLCSCVWPTFFALSRTKMRNVHFVCLCEGWSCYCICGNQLSPWARGRSPASHPQRRRDPCFQKPLIVLSVIISAAARVNCMFPRLITNQKVHIDWHLLNRKKDKMQGKIECNVCNASFTTTINSMLLTYSLCSACTHCMLGTCLWLMCVGCELMWVGCGCCGCCEMGLWYCGCCEMLLAVRIFEIVIGTVHFTTS